MHKNFTFKGVVRSNDNILANEGECLELVNLRMVNGSFRPIPESVERAVLPDKFSRIYWHDKANCHICIKSEEPNGVCFYDSSWSPLLDSNGGILEFPLLEGVKSVELLGYIAVFLTENGLRYIVFGDGTYRWLGESPHVPAISVSLSSKLYETVTEVSFTRGFVDTDISSTWAYNARGYFDECIAKANKEGHYVDRALFRFALRLYDGSYIYCSHVIYVADNSEVDGLTRDAGNFVSYPVNESQTESRYQVSVLAFKPQFEFTDLQLGNWEGIVTGIDVFTTGSIVGQKIEAVTTTLLDTETKQSTTEKYEIYSKKELDELWNEINNASLFYKVAEYDINGNLQHAVDDVSQANIVLQDALSSFEQTTSYSSIVPGCSYMFNNRLHIASLHEYFFKGYGECALQPAGCETVVVDRVTVLTRIKTQNGISVVMNSFRNARVGYIDGSYLFSPLLMYPDARAFEMTVFVDNAGKVYMKTFALTPHKFLNQAQYLHKWYLGYDVDVSAVFASGKDPAVVSKATVLEIFNEEVGVHEVIYSSQKGCWTYKGDSFPPSEYSTLRIFQIPRDVAEGDKLLFTITESTSDTTFRDINNIPFDATWQQVDSLEQYKESNTYEERGNVMKVSMVDNPFVFPAKCTYPLSNGKVLALSTNRSAMSEGQFGEHPLYVFSQRGVDVMSVDVSGTVAYSNMYPVSHEVCRNPDTVCGTDTGVVFLGSQGLMLINGARCMRLSVAVDNDSKELQAIERSGIITRIATLYGLESSVDTTSFDDFMSMARVGRLRQTDELLFCNSNYSYSLVYSMSGNIWSKIGERYDGFVQQLPEFYMFSHNSNTTTVYAPGDMVSGKGRVMLVTRPYIFGTKLPKRIMQFMLHAYLSKPDGLPGLTPFTGCFLLCSNDGMHFKLVAGCERGEETQDIVFPYFPTCSYRYYMFALVGEMNATSMITGLEIDICPAWNNKLR